MRPFCRAERALDASCRLIEASLRMVEHSQRCARQQPRRSWSNLHQASEQLRQASRRLVRAASQLARVKDWVHHQPAGYGSVIADLLKQATRRYAGIQNDLDDAFSEVFMLQVHVQLGLESGVLVPEPPDPRAGRRPRIRLAPRPVPIRAFLRLRQPRLSDRIAPLLRRRRATPRPAAVRVPRRSLVGRAPPAVSISLL
jgi:hypothetical protein